MFCSYYLLSSFLFAHVKQLSKLSCCATLIANKKLFVCRLLIAVAEKAAKVLEVAAVRSPTARTALLETKSLIAEAIRSIETIDRGITSPMETVPVLSNQRLPMPYHSYPLSGLTDHIREERKFNGSAVQIQTPDGETNKSSFGRPLSCNQLGLEDASEIAGPNGLLISKGDLSSQQKQN